MVTDRPPLERTSRRTRDHDGLVLGKVGDNLIDDSVRLTQSRAERCVHVNLKRWSRRHEATRTRARWLGELRRVVGGRRGRFKPERISKGTPVAGLRIGENEMVCNGLSHAARKGRLFR